MVPFFAEESATVRSIVPKINALARALRAAGGTVAWVVPDVGGEPSPWAVGFYGPEVAERYRGSGGDGTLVDGLDVRAGDVRAVKSAASAFFPGRSTLPALLGRRVDTVLVAGTVTSVCCESTARDAATLGHRVVLVADACADVSDAAHNATLRTIYRSFGDVRPAGDLVALLAR